MKLSLEELRAQRELILRHLRWIEAKISELEKGEPTEAAPENAEGAPRQESSEVAAVADIAIPGESTLRASTASQVKQAQVGCLLLFIGACTLFLFFLFGLPYLIDDSNPPDEAVPETQAPEVSD